MRDYNLVVLGAGGVGKSALTAQYVQGVFLEQYDPTIEDAYRKQTVIDGRSYSLDILDTAGIEQFTAMRELYIRNAEGFILAYSITSKASFNELKALREQVARIKDNSNVPIVLVGNKRDLAASAREVAYAEAKELAASWGGVPFFESSAKSYINVDEIFQSLIRNLVRRDSAIGSALGSSLRNSSIFSSIDNESRYSRHPSFAGVAGPGSGVGATAGSQRRLRVKQSLAKLKEKKSIRRLVSVASFASLRPPKDLRQRASQFFGSGRGPSGLASVANKENMIPEHFVDDKVNVAAAQLELPRDESGGLNLSAAPEILTVAPARSRASGKCVIM